MFMLYICTNKYLFSAGFGLKALLFVECSYKLLPKHPTYNFKRNVCVFPQPFTNR